MFFKVLKRSKASKARLGEINTSHGVIKTPAFVAVGTKGTIKTLTPDLVKSIGTQVAFVNTYHLVSYPGSEVVEKADGIHKYSGLNMPLMSDSGGFQVFSLARNKTRSSNFFHTRVSPRQRRGPLESEKITSTSFLNGQKKADVRGEEEPILVKISDDGVKFRSTFDGRLIEFTPEKSIEYQMMIGADINMAFDECTYYGASHEYTEKAMERTHNWLKRCIDYKKFQLSVGSFQLDKNEKFKMKNNQYLYGVIQGGVYEDLRKKSAEFVVSQNTDGVAIGGVSVGETKKEMRDQVRWVADYLPKDRPVHLLGVGHIDDILDLVKYGIDTFDCVEPTRLARMGILYKARHQNFLSPVGPLSTLWKTSQVAKNLVPSLSEEIDITKSIYKNNLEPVDVDCDCYVCKNFTKSYLHHLFKQREILGYTLATYHNLWIMEKLFDKIRELIVENKI